MSAVLGVARQAVAVATVTHDRGVSAATVYAQVVRATAVAQQGPAGRNAENAVLSFPIAAASSFTGNHAFPYQPRAWLVDAAGAEVETDILHGPGQVTAIFPQPFSGTLYLG